jgi:hypothetical protein
MNEKLRQQRRAFLAEMEGIERMEFGALAEEYRPSQAAGETARNGPYYKHQQWREGRNRSRRVPVEEAGPLREAIAGRQRFEELVKGFVELTVAATRGEESQRSKKNSARRRSKRNMARRKAS